MQKKKPKATDGREIGQKKYCIILNVEAEMRFQEVLVEMRETENLVFYMRHGWGKDKGTNNCPFGECEDGLLLIL